MKKRLFWATLITVGAATAYLLHSFDKSIGNAIDDALEGDWFNDVWN